MKGNFLAASFIDLQKAFDTVKHDILLTKLDYYGVTGRENDWLGLTYLTGNNLFQ